MTPEEFLEKMKKIYSEGYDVDDAHVEADFLMADVLKEHGYGEGADVFLIAVYS